MTDEANGTVGATQSDAGAGTRDSRDVGQPTGNGNGLAVDQNDAAADRNDAAADRNDAAADQNDAAAEEDRIARGTGVREQIARGLRVRKQNRLNVPEQAVVRTPEQARVTMPGRPGNVAESSRVPSWLQTGAAWSWRLLLLAAAIYLVARVLGILYIVVVPCIAALLLTALLQPLTARLRRAGLHPLAATWATLAIAAAVLGGLGPARHQPGVGGLPDHGGRGQAHDHAGGVVAVRFAFSRQEQRASRILLNNIPSYISKHKSLVEGTVVTGGKIAAEFFGGLVLMIFVTFFLIKDGERIWNWLLGSMRPETARRMDRAGHASWLAVVYYMRGTVAVAAIHAIVVGLALWIMGVPLVIPLAVLVFVAAFVPLVGLLVAGTLAILVTLATKGWVDAIILLGILIIEDQLEAHLLQPQVVGRVIRLHPLAVILSLAVGGVLAGIPGAVVAIPVVAVITRALPELRRSDPDPDDPG